jgi:hypothetical protein
VDYVRQVLGDASGRAPQVPPPPPPLAFVPPAMPPSSPTPGRLARPAGGDRAQWERIALTPDVEVHVRRPLSREDNRRVESLLEKARDLFRGGGA